MDERGSWRLTPAYDLTYSHDPTSRWISQHQMGVNGKFDRFTRENLMALATTVSLPRSTADDIIQEVGTAVSRWEDFAAVTEIPRDYVQEIKENHRLELASQRARGKSLARLPTRQRPTVRASRSDAGR